jgi:hypothetical protein
MNNEVNKIISVYSIILENKSMLKEFNTVRLSDTNYSNVKYDNDATRNDTVNQALLDDIQQAASNVGIVATITTAKSGHRQQTTSGNTSRHMSGAGVDIGLLNGINSSGTEFRALGDKLKDSLVSLGYTWNSESGNPKSVLWQTNTGGNHYNHLHVSNNSGESSKPTDSSKFGDFNTDQITSTASNAVSSGFDEIKADPLITGFGKILTKAFGLTENVNRIKGLL